MSATKPSPDPATCRRLAARVGARAMSINALGNVVDECLHRSFEFFDELDLTEIARQLEAAAETAERIESATTFAERSDEHKSQVIGDLAAERDAARAEADQLRTQVSRLRAALAYVDRKIDGYDGIKDVAEEIANGTVSQDGMRRIAPESNAPLDRADSALVVTAPMAREVTDHERRISQLETAVARMVPVSATPPMVLRDYYVTVCSSCRRASCWHGELTCEANRSSGTVDVLASELVREWREHPSYFSVPRLRELCGEVRYVQNDAVSVATPDNTPEGEQEGRRR